MCIKLIAIKESLYAHCSMAFIRIKLVKGSNWQNIYQDNKSIKNGEKETFSTIELNENKIIRWLFVKNICQIYFIVIIRKILQIDFTLSWKKLKKGKTER